MRIPDGRPLAGAAQPAGCVRPDRRRGGAAAESRARTPAATGPPQRRAGRPLAQFQARWRDTRSRDAAPGRQAAQPPSWSLPKCARRLAGKPARYIDSPACASCLARAMTGASTMRPSSMNAPGPPSRCAAARAAPSPARRGRRETPWITGTWAGWMQSMPPKPICCALDAARARPAVSCTPGNTRPAPATRPRGSATAPGCGHGRARSRRPASQATTPGPARNPGCQGQPRHAGVAATSARLSTPRAVSMMGMTGSPSVPHDAPAPGFRPWAAGWRSRRPAAQRLEIVLVPGRGGVVDAHPQARLRMRAQEVARFARAVARCSTASSRSTITASARWPAPGDALGREAGTNSAVRTMGWVIRPPRRAVAPPRRARTPMMLAPRRCFRPRPARDPCAARRRCCWRAATAPAARRPGCRLRASAGAPELRMRPDAGHVVDAGVGDLRPPAAA